MPKNRNCRFTNSNFEFSHEFLKALPPPDQICASKTTPQLCDSLHFGEPLPVEYQKCGYGRIIIGGVSSSSDCDNISDFDIASFGRSSTSSVSWYDEFDVESTQRVADELEKLDRILQQKESIPLHYNRDEYEQWMKTFPNLNVFGNAERCDSSTLPPSKKAPNSIKFTVIEEVPSSNKQQKQTNRDLQRKRFDNILRISPAPLLFQEPSNRSFYLETRQQSSHTVYKSAKSASKWMREGSKEPTSLPYLITADSAKDKVNNTTSTSSSKIRCLPKTSLSSNNKNYLSLPPIKTITLPSASQYRSISATPRNAYSEQNVVSAHIESLKRRRKVIYDRLDSLRNILNYPK